jgi:hypothetical protein
MYRKLWIPLLFTLTAGATLQAQQLWPGDVNNNGVVNEVDLLYWGIAFGSTGSERDETGTDWQAYDLPDPWAQNFPNGNNYAFADCDGNGVVDEDDFDSAIEGNYDEQHLPPSPDGYSNAAAGSAAPKILLEPSVGAVQPGALVDITLRIDDSQMPLNDFYGIALSMSYTTGLLQGDDGPDFDLTEDSWIESDNSYVQELFNETDDQGKAALAITRTNQIAVPVEAGTMGTFSIVIEDIIVGLEIDTFFLWVDSVKLIGAELTSIPVVPDTAQVIVAKDLTLLDAFQGPSANVSDRVRLFPNPAKDQLFIQSEFWLENPVLTDQTGRSWAADWQTAGVNAWRLNCAALPPGLYWLRANNDRSTIVKKIIISH